MGTSKGLWSEANAYCTWEIKTLPQTTFAWGISPANASQPFNVSTYGYSSVAMLTPTCGTPAMTANGYNGLNRVLAGGMTSGNQSALWCVYRVEKFIVDWTIVTANTLAANGGNTDQWVATTNSAMCNNGHFQTVATGTAFGSMQMSGPKNQKLINGNGTYRFRQTVDMPKRFSITRNQWLASPLYETAAGVVPASYINCYLSMDPSSLPPATPLVFTIRCRIRAKIHAKLPSGYVANAVLNN